MCCMMLLEVLSSAVCLEYHPATDVFACVADIGWITGHSYVVYGPLCTGETIVLFEKHPTYPDPGTYVVHSKVAH